MNCFLYLFFRQKLCDFLGLFPKVFPISDGYSEALLASPREKLPTDGRCLKWMDKSRLLHIDVQCLNCFNMFGPLWYLSCTVAGDI